MDLKPQSQQSISDDQELAKVLAGISTDAPIMPAAEEIVTTPVPEPVIMPNPVSVPDPVVAAPVMPEPALAPVMPDPIMPSMPSSNGDLSGIKSEALGELRPLVGKLNVAPEEKFDTYLLLIRSTDDTSLIAPAHEAAKAIADEARRAQALLDIIKEIDFLSQPQA